MPAASIEFSWISKRGADTMRGKLEIVCEFLIWHGNLWIPIDFRMFSISPRRAHICVVCHWVSGRCGLSYRYSTYRAKGQHWCESYGLNANLIQTILFVVYFIGFLSVTRTHKHHDVHINNITAELNENVECELIERDIETMHTTREEDGYNVSLLKVSYIFIYYLASRKSVSVAIFCTCSALVRLVAHPWLIRYLVSFSFVRFAFNAGGQYHSNTISVLSISSFTDQFIGTMNITNTHRMDNAIALL